MATYDASLAYWRHLPADSAGKRWQSELQALLGQAFASPDWQCFGHAVIFESADVELVGGVLGHVAGSLGMEFALIEGSAVTPGLCDQLADQIDARPRLIFLEAGMWLNADPEESSASGLPDNGLEPAQSQQLRRDLAALLQGKAAEHPVVLATAVQSFQQMDAKLRCAGLFDRRVHLPVLEPLAMAGAFVEEIGDGHLDDSVTSQPDKLGALLHFEYPDSRRRSLLGTAVQRLAWRERRLVRYDDLVSFAVYGTADEDIAVDPPDVRYRHAVHEAGHALISLLESRQQQLPLYCSVLKRGGTHGVMVQPFDNHERQSDDLSYRDLVHSIRVALAGRAAEHLLLGSVEISGRGATSDLSKASRLAYSMFAQWGLSTNTGTDQAAASNLVITPEELVSDAHKWEWTKMVQHFLQSQFLEVLSVLQQHQDLLLAISHALTEKTFLVQGDFRMLLEQASSAPRRKAA